MRGCRAIGDTRAIQSCSGRPAAETAAPAAATPSPAALCSRMGGRSLPPRRGIARQRQAGYTLIEVIVAFALLALALTLLLGTLSGSARQVRQSADSGQAALYAQSLLDQTGVGVALQPGHRDGAFEDGRFRWSLDVAPYIDRSRPPSPLVDPSAAQLLQLSLAMEWGDAGPAQRLRLQSLRLVTPDVDGSPPGAGGPAGP